MDDTSDPERPHKLVNVWGMYNWNLFKGAYRRRYCNM